MTLNEYMASDDSNAFWRLSSGDHQNLLDDAVERMMDAREALVAVLCDPEGNVCIQGSDADRDVVRKALDTLSVANVTDERRGIPRPSPSGWSCPWCGCDETWFDRTITYLPDGTEDGMKTRCTKCGRATDNKPNK